MQHDQQPKIEFFLEHLAARFIIFLLFDSVFLFVDRQKYLHARALFRLLLIFFSFSFLLSLVGFIFTTFVAGTLHIFDDDEKCFWFHMEKIDTRDKWPQQKKKRQPHTCLRCDQASQASRATRNKKKSLQNDNFHSELPNILAFDRRIGRHCHASFVHFLFELFLSSMHCAMLHCLRIVCPARSVFAI